jgi:hypothetical protein
MSIQHITDILEAMNDPSRNLTLNTTPKLRVRIGNHYHEITIEQDINSIYKQNTFEYGYQAIRKVYSIAGLEDPVKEINTDYNHNYLSKLIQIKMKSS